MLDGVGKGSLTRSYDVVKKGGIVVTIAGQPDQAELDKRGIRGASIRSSPKAETLEELTKLIEAGKLKPLVSQVLPLSEGAKAQDQVTTRHTRGKIVLKVADTPRR